MRIDYADGKVVSTIGNSLHSPQAEKHNAGIGLENVRKRLSLIYGPKIIRSISKRPKRPIP